MNRFYPAFVSFLGSLGVAFALAYFGAVILSFSPRWNSLGEFMVGGSDGLSFGFLLVVVPYVLLLLNLFLRVRVGNWLIERGEPKQALAYASVRTKPILRNGREITAHRLACVRANMMLLDYEAAQAHLSFDPPLKRNPALSGWARWGLELYLRTEDLVSAREWAARFETIESDDDESISFHAARMELAVRNGDVESYERAFKKVTPGTTNARLNYVRTLATDYEKISLETRLDNLVQVTPEIVRTLPGYEGELLVLKSQLLTENGNPEAGHEALVAAETAGGDARSQYIISKQTAES